MRANIGANLKIIQHLVQAYLVAEGERRSEDYAF